MRFVRAFWSFWYQLVVGDDWRIAASAGVALCIGAVTAANGIISGSALAVVIAALIAVGFVANLVGAARSGGS